MLGFLIGTACLFGLVKVIRRGRYGHFRHMHACGGPWSHGGFGGYGGWDERGYGGDYGDDGAWGDGPWGRHGGGSFVMRGIFERLDTTPGQEKVIRAAFDELREKGRAVKEDARGMRKDLAGALRGESLDAETLGTAASRASNAVDGVRDAAIGALLKVHEVLDERQRGILADFIESGPRFGGWGRGGGRWRGRREGRGGPYRGARV
jgi:uncharacterized membrane protein